MIFQWSSHKLLYNHYVYVYQFSILLFVEYTIIYSMSTGSKGDRGYIGPQGK